MRLNQLLFTISSRQHVFACERAHCPSSSWILFTIYFSAFECKWRVKIKTKKKRKRKTFGRISKGIGPIRAPSQRNRFLVSYTGTVWVILTVQYQNDGKNQNLNKRRECVASRRVRAWTIETETYCAIVCNSKSDGISIKCHDIHT